MKLLTCDIVTAKKKENSEAIATREKPQSSGTLSPYWNVPHNFTRLFYNIPFIYSDSDMARAARVFQPVVNVKKDYDSDSDTEKTSNKLSHEDITIKERYDKVWQGSEEVVVIIMIIIIIDDNNNYNKSVLIFVMYM